MMANIEDVAREAKVSVATVSRVINNIGVVKPSTIDKVNAAIEKLSYVPNLSARNLRKNESRIILILTPNFTNPYYSQVLSGICDISRELGYSILVYSTHDSLALDEKLVIDLFRTNRADGMITLACKLDDTWLGKYKDQHTIVQCSEYVNDLTIPHISIDNRKAAKESVANLIKMGHSRIGIIYSVNKYMSNAMRYQGYCDALAEAGIEFNDKYAARADMDYSFASGKQAASTLLSQDEPPTALFCVSDIIALGAMAQAEKQGMKVPADLSVVGFDDVDYTTMFHPHLTTTSIPCYDLGRQSMQFLQQHMLKQNAINEVILPHHLVTRESAAFYSDI